MIEWVKDMTTWWTTGLLGLVLYWLPLSLCVVGYTLRAWQQLQNDRSKREENGGVYIPHITIGSLIGWAVVCVIPVANLWAAAFDVSPSLFGSLFKRIGQLFDMPLVPDAEKYKALRKKDHLRVVD